MNINIGSTGRDSVPVPVLRSMVYRDTIFCCLCLEVCVWMLDGRPLVNNLPVVDTFWAVLFLHWIQSCDVLRCMYICVGGISLKTYSASGLYCVSFFLHWIQNCAVHVLRCLCLYFGRELPYKRILRVDSTRLFFVYRTQIVLSMS